MSRMVIMTDYDQIDELLKKEDVWYAAREKEKCPMSKYAPYSPPRVNGRFAKSL